MSPTCISPVMVTDLILLSKYGQVCVGICVVGGTCVDGGVFTTGLHREWILSGVQDSTAAWLLIHSYMIFL